MLLEEIEYSERMIIKSNFMAKLFAEIWNQAWMETSVSVIL